MTSRHAPFWQSLHQQLNDHPAEPVQVYFKSHEGAFEGLPLVFRAGQPRLLAEAGLANALRLPEPAKTAFLKRYQAGRIFTLAAACRHYFGPLYRPGRQPGTYDPLHELFLSVADLARAFPDLRDRFPYGSHIRLEKLAALYADRPAEPLAEEKEVPYQTPVENFPLNQILYGPPGTGKTYQAIHYAVAVIEGKPLAEVQAEDRAAVQQRYGQYQAAGQVDFVTFHQNYAYEEFVQGLRPDTHRHTDSLHFRLVDGVFKRLADRARTNYEAYRRTMHRPALPFEMLLDQMLVQGMNRETEEVELPLGQPGSPFKSLIVYETTEAVLRYKRRTTRDTVREEERLLYLHKLRDRFQGREIGEAINRPYYDAVVRALRAFEKNLKRTKSEDQLRRYVLIIDEINRGNISRVLGELITLIEEDKRLGGAHPLTATLPSGEPFAVPANLYLVGTMNTADKSVALLDAALRRRFAFVPLFPDYSLIPAFAGVLQRLNRQLIEQKGPDFLIGHAYFLHQPAARLPAIFNRHIVPLLYDYFHHRPEPVRQVLEGSGLAVAEQNHLLHVTGAQPAP